MLKIGCLKLLIRSWKFVCIRNWKKIKPLN